MSKRYQGDFGKHGFGGLYGTYEKGDSWVTPFGEYNIVHYDCPTEEEIKARVTDAINEIVCGDNLDDDCPLCQDMASYPYDIVYYCLKFCHECEKARICKNFNTKKEIDFLGER